MVYAMPISFIYLSVYIGLFGIAGVNINTLLHCFTVHHRRCMIVWWESCWRSSLAWRSWALRWPHCAVLCANRKRMWACPVGIMS